MSRTKRILEARELTRGQGKNAFMVQIWWLGIAESRQLRRKVRGCLKGEPGTPFRAGAGEGAQLGGRELFQGKRTGQSPAEAALLLSLREGSLLHFGSWGNEGLPGGG